MLLRERNPEQEGDAMGGKKDIPRTVRLDEDLDAWAQSSAAECECSFSDLVRTALLLAVPPILACPSMLRRLDLDDFDGAPSRYRRRFP